MNIKIVVFVGFLSVLVGAKFCPDDWLSKFVEPIFKRITGKTTPISNIRRTLVLLSGACLAAAAIGHGHKRLADGKYLEDLKVLGQCPCVEVFRQAFPGEQDPRKGITLEDVSYLIPKKSSKAKPMGNHEDVEYIVCETQGKSCVKKDKKGKEHMVKKEHVGRTTTVRGQGEQQSEKNIVDADGLDSSVKKGVEVVEKLKKTLSDLGSNDDDEKDKVEMKDVTADFVTKSQKSSEEETDEK